MLPDVETTAPPAHQDRARVLALLPILETRYRWLRALLRDAAAGEELTDWDLDLALADLDGVLTIMRGAATEDEEDGAP